MITGFSTDEDMVYFHTTELPEILLYFTSDFQKKAFVGLHLDEDPAWYIESKFGGEEGLIKEAEDLFDEERFEETFETILRVMADQSTSRTEVELTVLKKVFIFR